MTPDDWRYACIQDACEAIAEAEDPDEARYEFCDDTDVYNGDLVTWVGSHGRGSYVDEAREELGEAPDFYQGLMRGQAMERGEVYDLVLSGLRGLADEEE